MLKGLLRRTPKDFLFLFIRTRIRTIKRSKNRKYGVKHIHYHSENTKKLRHNSINFNFSAKIVEKKNIIVIDFEFNNKLTKI